MRCHWAILCIGFAACRGPGTSSPAVAIDTLPGGIVHVVNHLAAGQDSIWRLVLERTMQPATGSPGELVAPRDLVASDDGHLFVLESKPAAINEFGPDGAFIRVVARAGAGPGEISDGVMYLARDTLVFQDAAQGRMTTFTPDGHPLRIWHTENMAENGSVADDSGRVPLPLVSSTTAINSGQAVERFRLDSTVADTIRYPSAPEPKAWRLRIGRSNMGMLVPFSPDHVTLFDRSGRLISGDQATGRLTYSVHGPDTVLVVDLPLPAVPIPDSVRRATYDSTISHFKWLNGVAHLDDIPLEYPRWSALVTDGNNNLWVLAPGPRGVADHWLVVSPQGRVVATVPARFDDPGDGFWTRDHLYLIRTSADGAPAILVYRVGRQ